MRCDQSQHDLQSVIRGLVDGDWPCPQAPSQRLTLQEFGDDVGRAVLQAHVVNRNDVGMVQRGSRPCFLVKAPHMVWIGAGGRANELEGYVSTQSLVTGSKDLAHPSFADFFEDPVMSHQLASHMFRRRAVLGMLGAAAYAVNTGSDTGRQNAYPKIQAPDGMVIRVSPRRRSQGGTRAIARAIISVRLHSVPRQSYDLLYGRILRHH